MKCFIITLLPNHVHILDDLHGVIAETYIPYIYPIWGDVPTTSDLNAINVPEFKSDRPENGLSTKYTSIECI